MIVEWHFTSLLEANNSSINLHALLDLILNLNTTLRHPHCCQQTEKMIRMNYCTWRSGQTRGWTNRFGSAELVFISFLVRGKEGWKWNSGCFLVARHLPIPCFSLQQFVIKMLRFSFSMPTSFVIINSVLRNSNVNNNDVLMEIIPCDHHRQTQRGFHLQPSDVCQNLNLHQKESSWKIYRQEAAARGKRKEKIVDSLICCEDVTDKT